MPPSIETFQKPAQGVAIVWDGEAAPTFVVPFPGGTLIGAFAAGAEAVVCIGSRSSRAGSGHPGTTLFARFERATGRLVRRGEIDGLRARGALACRDCRAILVSAHEGFAAVDAVSLRVTRRVELLRFDGDEVSTSTWDERDGLGPRIYEMNSKRWGPKFAGWHTVMVQADFQVGETDDGAIMHVDRWMRPAAPGEGAQQGFQVLGRGGGPGRKGTIRSQVAPTALDHVDPGAEILHVTRRQVALFRAAPPQSVDCAGAFACPDPQDHAVVLHLWPLDRPGAVPTTLSVRTAARESWAAGIVGSSWWHSRAGGGRDDLLAALDQASPHGEVDAPVFWSAAASHLLPKVFEDPRDGLVWLSFADDRVRSLDGAGMLGPLIVLGGAPNVPDDEPYLRHPCPDFAFQGKDAIVVRRHDGSGSGKMARYLFRAVDVFGRAGPITLTPARPGPLPGSHAKAFAAFVRGRRRDRFALPDWSRSSVAAALDAQRAAVAAGLPDLLDDEDRLTFSYKVADKPVKEAAFFRRIAKDALPVVPELRALLTAYTDALGTGGEGVQPWQDPDEAVGGLGPALHALALLDPDGLGVLRAYLETRDGEHEGYALDFVVPAFFERHGWRDAEAVRFGIYATLNRFWGGRKPPQGFEGMRKAMARLLTPGEAIEAVLREAKHFGRKPDWGYDAAAYRAAFCSLLSPSDPYEAAVLDGIAGDPAEG